MNLHLHKYTKWEDRGYFNIFEYADDTRPMYKYIVQHKRCVKCNRLKSRRIKQ